jgi:hypothetical protein
MTFENIFVIFSQEDSCDTRAQKRPGRRKAGIPAVMRPAQTGRGG